MTRAEVLTLLEQDPAPAVLARCELYVPAPSRDGSLAGRERIGRIFLHKPAAAILLPSDFPTLSRRRPDFGGLRHALVRFGFMLDRLPTRHAYESATLTITLSHPDAVVLAQRPAQVVTESATSGSTMTDLSAAIDGLAKLGAQRTRTTQSTSTETRPLVTAENRGTAGFGWHYQAQDGVPLLPRVESAQAVIELPRDADELAGSLSAEAVISVPRFGVFTKSRTEPTMPPAPFRLLLGPAG